VAFGSRSLLTLDLFPFSYLLEKTRITRQSTGERNYHIFYQLLSGADEELLRELGLEGGSGSFSYLMNGPSKHSAIDAEAFHRTLQCLTSIGLSLDEQRSVLGMVAAVLHIGNVRFEADKRDADIAKISDESRFSLAKACELLGIDEAKVSEAILTKNLVVDGTLIKKQQSVQMAVDKRDALAKMTYSCLFLWLVKTINDTLNASSQESNGQGLIVWAFGNGPHTDVADQGFIGVLDIYGFECFDNNGFEQLLINYCNEKLQRHFNRHLFEVEQRLYASQGVDWSYITFNDNRPCLELIEGGVGIVGIMNTLDDAWGGIGSTSEKDTKFVAHLYKLFGTPSAPSTPRQDELKVDTVGHKDFVIPKIGTDKQFIIIHYAGQVSITVLLNSCLMGARSRVCQLVLF
jgi:myosin heavy subunit